MHHSALVVANEGEDCHNRVGRLDVLAQQIDTVEAIVSTDKLISRWAARSFKDESLAP